MVGLPPVLETDRLRIRPFGPRDVDGYLAFMTDPEATRYLMLTEEQRSRSGARALLDAVVASYDSPDPILALAIAHRESDQFIGSCGVSPLGRDGELECYYSLLSAHRGRGYATEATRALLAHYLAREGVEAIWAFMSPANPHSAGVAERAGMEPMGEMAHPIFGSPALAWVARPP